MAFAEGLGRLGFGPDFFNSALDQGKRPIDDLFSLVAPSTGSSQAPPAIGPQDRPSDNGPGYNPFSDAFGQLLPTTPQNGGAFMSPGVSRENLPYTMPRAGTGADPFGSTLSRGAMMTLPFAMPKATPNAVIAGGTTDPAARSNLGASADGSFNADEILSIADDYLGTPYVFGAAAGQSSSFDCSSYTQFVYNRAGVTLPRTAQEQYNMTQRIGPDQAQPGDLIFFQGTYAGPQITHVAIYMGNGKFIGAQGSDVNVGSLSNPYWNERFVGFGHVPGYNNHAAGAAVADVASAPNVRDADQSVTGEGNAANGGQAKTSIVQMAAQVGGSDFAHVIGGILDMENGINNPVGDNGTSFGPFQFHMGGELDGYARYLGVSREQAAQRAMHDPSSAAEYAFHYLLPVYQEGVQAGLTGENLLYYVQVHGQRSVPPSAERVHSAWYGNQ
jgi:cell wall-associated NlpC family hydrolase